MCLSLALSNRWFCSGQCSKGEALVSFHMDYFCGLKEGWMLFVAQLSHLDVNILSNIFRK